MGYKYSNTFYIIAASYIIPRGLANGCPELLVLCPDAVVKDENLFMGLGGPFPNSFNESISVDAVSKREDIEHPALRLEYILPGSKVGPFFPPSYVPATMGVLPMTLNLVAESTASIPRAAAL
jgi:hypothetical protein